MTAQPVTVSSQPTSSHHDLTEYKSTKIGSLIVGPARVNFAGRIVNIIHRPWSGSGSSSASPDGTSKPSGYFKYIVGDATGTVVVKHFYVTALQEYFNLGSLISIYATHISPKDPNASSSAKHDCFFISIFPERDPTVLMTCLDESDGDNASLCRIPLGYHLGLKYLRGIKSLNELMAGSETKERQVLRLVVAVKSIGPRRKICLKKDEVDRIAFTVEVIVRDRTDEATISLWDYATEALRYWKAGETVLLLSNPDVKRDGGRERLTMGPTTCLQIDPDFHLAVELRTWAKAKRMEESVNIPFPEGVFDIEGFLSSSQRIKFTLGDIDEFIRAGEQETYIGYFSLIIFETSLAKIWSRNMLCCAECCGRPIFANAVSGQCQSCGRDVGLRINPGIVDTLSDETGSISGKKLIWSDKAWTRLLGRTPEKLVEASEKGIKDIESALLYCRTTFLMGWHPDIGRLVVCDLHL